MIYRTEYSPEEWTNKTNCCTIEVNCEICNTRFTLNIPYETKNSYGFSGRCCNKEKFTFVSKNEEFNSQMRELLLNLEEN